MCILISVFWSDSVLRWFAELLRDGFGRVDEEEDMTIEGILRGIQRDNNGDDDGDNNNQTLDLCTRDVSRPAVMHATEAKLVHALREQDRRWEDTVLSVTIERGRMCLE